MLHAQTHRRAPLGAALLLATTLAPHAAAQLVDRELPVYAADGDAADVYRGPFVHDSFRWQQIWHGPAIAEKVATLTGLAYRRDNGQKSAGRNWNGRRIPRLEVLLGSTTFSPMTMSTSFASNANKVQTTVFAGTWDLPANPAPPQKDAAAPWNVAIRFTQPYAYVPGTGDLLLEMRTPQGSTQTGDYNLDGAEYGGIAGTTIQMQGNSGSMSDKSTPQHVLDSAFFPFDGQHTPAIGFRVLKLQRAYPGITMLGTSNRKFGALTLPFSLAPLGAPGNTLYTSIDLTLPLPFVTRFGRTEGELVVHLPNDPSIGGHTFYSQGALLDGGANALGLVLTNAMAFTFGTQPASLTRSLNGAPATATTGLLDGNQRPGGPAILFQGVFQ